MKYLPHEYWVVERKGQYWTDYINSEAECYGVMDECAMLNGDSIEIYTCRPMTDNDFIKHYPEQLHLFE